MPTHPCPKTLRYRREAATSVQPGGGGVGKLSRRGPKRRLRVARGPKKTNPRPAHPRFRGAHTPAAAPEADDSRRPFQVDCRQVFWLPAYLARCAFPSTLHTSTVAFAAAITGYSGASAADFHGLPFSFHPWVETCNALTIDLKNRPSSPSHQNSRRPHCKRNGRPFRKDRPSRRF